MTDTPLPPEIEARRALMALCAGATAAELAAALDGLGPIAAHEELRAPEPGLVMVRGRMGGDGRPFNLGEATVTRAVVRLATGETGFAYQLGRDRDKARRAALLDALAQIRPAAVSAALAPIRNRIEAERDVARRRTAATRVNFFTLQRGEDT
ncbi:phosphonate C-P lyase system protein PhnG [Prosthecomicrobium pneumaticum]|uniref:Alpha-D-ribose 1-methylphosphonate 5-triphosphate synthase subunit PhnG n=1 Tax=Prosthecomicrobium pneumaticum TaxID=81895 RepID=A0A7W9L1R8_9HYPH|nr:alpha-D-ribose 1-methylphosphonate 5-triphosphate synthase subunit PhnG [Prosthecomicrobium pneumaticum]